MTPFQRITTNPEICGGKPCIRGLRYPVSRLLGLLAAGETSETILESYPYLEKEDIQEALQYAAFLAEEQIIKLRLQTETHNPAFDFLNDPEEDIYSPTDGEPFRDEVTGGDKN